MRFTPSLGRWRGLLGLGERKKPIQNNKTHLNVEALENRLVPATNYLGNAIIYVDNKFDDATITPLHFTGIVDGDRTYHARTLRDAIEGANADVQADDGKYLNGDDTINLKTKCYDVELGQLCIKLTQSSSGGQEPSFGSGSLKIKNNEGGMSGIDADGNSRIFHVKSNDPGESATFKWLCIINGRDDFEGGGILNEGDLKIVQCAIKHNTAGDPENVFNTGRGGGIFNAGELTITESSFEHNTAVGGEGADGLGGGLFAEDGSTTKILGTTFLENDAIGGGGSTFGRFAESQVSYGGDGGDGLGGAIYVDGDANLNVKNSTFSRNTAIGGSSSGITPSASHEATPDIGFYGGFGGDGIGGAIALGEEGESGAVAKIINCTIAQNKAIAGTGGDPSLDGDAYGGGIATSPSSYGGDVDILNTIVALNHVTPGGGEGEGDKRANPHVASDCNSPDVYGHFHSLGTNLIGILDSGASGFVASDLKGTCDAPLLPHINALDYNGGPKRSGPAECGCNLVIRTYSLRNNSPAVDAANDSVLSSLNFDQRGDPFKRKIGFHVDIGAYEGPAPVGISSTEVFG